MKSQPRTAPRAQGQASKRKAAAAARGQLRHRRPVDDLPGWGELDPVRQSAAATGRADALLGGMSTTRFALLVLALAAAFTLYVGHVHATQDLLAELQRARRENLQLHLRYNRLKGAYDQATGPRVIYDRARALGLEEGYAYGPTIHLEP